MAIWPKFDNPSISVKEITETSLMQILLVFDQHKHFF